MLHDALTFLLTTIFGLLTALFLLRFLFQYFRVPFQNQLAQAVVSLTDFAVKPARKWLPALGAIDLSTLILGFLTQLILQFSLYILKYSCCSTNHLMPISLLAIVGVIKVLLDIFFYAVLLQAILSWLNPYHPVISTLQRLTNPVLNPVRRLLPQASGIDFSPFVLLVLLQMFNIAIIFHIEKLLYSYF